MAQLFVNYLSGMLKKTILTLYLNEFKLYFAKIKSG